MSDANDKETKIKKLLKIAEYVILKSEQGDKTCAKIFKESLLQ